MLFVFYLWIVKVLRLIIVIVSLSIVTFMAPESNIVCLFLNFVKFRGYDFFFYVLRLNGVDVVLRHYWRLALILIVSGFMRVIII